MTKEEVNKQIEDFKSKFGKYPVFPVIVQYKYAGTNVCRGRIDHYGEGIMIRGVPGLISPFDNDIKELKMVTIYLTHQDKNFPYFRVKSWCYEKVHCKISG